MKLVFGNSDYISSLITNRPLISTLTNDFAERHLLFIGCSLTDELDILYALAQANITAAPLPSNNRVYITANEPLDYESKKKLRNYGVTEVLVVDYAEFYSFVTSIDNPYAAIKSPIDPYYYEGKTPARRTQKTFLQYLLQTSWNTHEDPTGLAVSRDILNQVSELITEPVVVLWGRRFSGRTTLLFEVLSRHSNRKRYFIPSSAAGSDIVFNALLRTKDALIAIDTGAISYTQLRRISQKFDQIRENNSTLVLATNRASLSALGSCLDSSALEVKDRMSYAESKQINDTLEPFGLAKNWLQSMPHLDNIFALSKSPVVSKLLNKQSRLHENISRLHHQWVDSEVGKLDFSILFYLGTRQRIYSRNFRELAQAAKLGHLASSYFEDFAKKWEPFVELEDADTSSSRSERSFKVIVSNANAWVHYAIRELTIKLGAEETAKQIVHTFSVMNKVEDKAFELLLFDNLNAIFTENLHVSRTSVILGVYECLASHLSSDADYWLQRAKGIYYLSNQVDDLVVAVEYCEKSIVKRSAKTNTNAKLTKANLLGKICKVKRSPEDSDVMRAVEAYVEAIDSRSENPLYIDELLRKSKTEKSYMSLVCSEASKRAALLSHKHEINLIQSYVGGRH